MDRLEVLLKDAESSEKEYGGKILFELEFTSDAIDGLMNQIRILDGFAILSKDKIGSIIRVCNQYLDEVLLSSMKVLISGIFDNRNAVLHFVTSLKKASFTQIPPSFFIMVNTLTICLMFISKEDLTKIKKFVSYWLDRIEFENLENDEYDYPKYLLRSSLCNILTETKDFEDCLKQANFNMKEISSDLKLKMKNSKEPDSNMREKVRILVMSILYKIDCLVALNDSEGVLQSAREMLDKAENLVEKYGLKVDTKLTESIKRKKKLLDSYKSLDEFNFNSLNSYFEITPQSGQKMQIPLKSDRNNFILRSKRGESATKTPQIKVTRKSPEILRTRLSVDYSPKFSTQTGVSRKYAATSGTRSPKTGFFASRNRRNEDEDHDLSDSVISSTRREIKSPEKGVLKKKGAIRESRFDGYGASNKEYMNHKTSKLKNEFSREIGELFKITDFFRKEISEIKQSIPVLPNNNKPTISVSKKPSTKKNSRYNSEIENLEESESIASGNKALSIDQKIKKAFDTILSNQAEIDDKSRMLAEKLEKLEKNIERQTTIETSSFGPQLNLFLKGIGDSPMEIKTKIQSKSVLPGENNTHQMEESQKKQQLREDIYDSSIQSFNPKAKETESNNFLQVTKKSQNGRSSRTSITSEVSVHLKYDNSNILGYNSALKYCLHKFAKPESSFKVPENDKYMRKLRMKIESSGKIYDLQYILSYQNPPEEASVHIQIFEQSSNFSGKPITEETLDVEMLRFILKKVPSFEVLPTNLPATCYVHLGYFLTLVLTKFLEVDHSDPTFLKISIQNYPRNLFDEQIITSFFGEKHSLTLIHLNGINFRLLIRKLKMEDDQEEKENEAILMDLYLNDFVLSTFFEVSCVDCSEIFSKIEKGEALSKEENEKFINDSNFNKEVVWMVANEESKVESSSQRKS